MSSKRWPKGTWMQLTSADTLKALMDQKKYSHERLGRYAGCSRGFISHLTSGRKNSCSAVLAERIVEALDVPLQVLFTPGDSTDGRSFPKHKGRAA
ncbi:MAG: helix-turn-helix domain-containing protein [Isosphaeraceae bacterium]